MPREEDRPQPGPVEAEAGGIESSYGPVGAAAARLVARPVGEGMGGGRQPARWLVDRLISDAISAIRWIRRLS